MPAQIAESLGTHARELSKKVEQFNQDPRMKLLLGAAPGHSVPGASSPAKVPRTMAQPDYSMDQPLDVTRDEPPLGCMAKDDFESKETRLGGRFLDSSLGLRSFAACPAVCDSNIRVVLTESKQVWLVSSSADAVHLTSGELFGYGLGAFSQHPTGEAWTTPASSVYRCGEGGAGEADPLHPDG